MCAFVQQCLYYAIVLSDCKGWNDGRAEEAVKHVHGWS